MTFRRIASIILFLMLSSKGVWGQFENIPLASDVYSFLRELSAAGAITGYNEADPNKTKLEIQRWLSEADKNRHKLSTIANQKLNRYLDDLYPGTYSKTPTIFSRDGSVSFIDTVWFPPVRNYTFILLDSLATTLAEVSLQPAILHETGIPRPSGAATFEAGFLINGTFLKHIGYGLGLIKGMGWGPYSTLKTWDPRLNYNFKFLENHEYMIVKNYDFTSGYLQWGYSPTDNIFISVQAGREPTTFGYGYGSKLILSGTHPDLDFLRFRVKYKQFSYHTLHASTVGDYDVDANKRVTKFIVHHRFQWEIPQLVTVGFGESVIYHRSLDLGYLSPLSILKFTEASLQDRDNSFFFLDFQSNVQNGFQLQGTLLFDESPFFNIPFPDRFSNKLAAQIGFFWYQPVTMDDLSLTMEYTWIRPYVYSHVGRETNYLAWGWPLGHRIGPNADEWMGRISYDLKAFHRLETEYRFIRKGRNKYAPDGTLLLNVGADPSIYYRDGIDPEFVKFLDGEKTITHEILFRYLGEVFADQDIEVGFKVRRMTSEVKKTEVTNGSTYIRYIIQL